MTGMDWISWTLGASVGRGLLALGLGLATSMGIATAILAAPLKDGVYFYGQSPQGDVLGKEYVVFQVQQQQIRGAIYYPAAEYACFTGHENDQGLHLLLAMEGEEPSIYAIPWETAATVSADAHIPLEKGRLRGYQPIAQLTALAQSLLAICASPWSVANP